MKFYLAVTVQQKIKSIYKYNAYIIPITDTDNIISILECVDGLIHANIYHTKKKAAEVVQIWNNSYKNNGTYLFDGTF